MELLKYLPVLLLSAIYSQPSLDRNGRVLLIDHPFLQSDR